MRNTNTMTISLPSEIAKQSHGFRKGIFLCVFKDICHCGYLLFHNFMLLFNRKGSFRTESVPDGKLPAGNHR